MLQAGALRDLTCPSPIFKTAQWKVLLMSHDRWGNRGGDSCRTCPLATSEARTQARED